MSKKSVEKGKISQKTRVMVFGTFDGLHPGHLNFFKQARKLAPDVFLVVSVARDRNVLQVKGRKPFLNDEKRAALIKKSGLADQVMLSGLGNHIPHIVRARPDIIALGYDQRAYVRNLKNDLAEKDLFPKIVRLKPYKEKIYKNTLLRRKGSGR